MHDATCVRELLHQLARTACVIEVHVRKKNEVDIADIQVFLAECLDEQWNAVVYAGVDESSTTIFNDQMTGVVQEAHVFGVDGDDAIVELYSLRVQSLLRFGGFEPVEPSIVFGKRGNVAVAECSNQRRHNRIRARAITILIQSVHQIVFMLSG